jgi:hypothetical protein
MRMNIAMSIMLACLMIGDVPMVCISTLEKNAEAGIFSFSKRTGGSSLFESLRKIADAQETESSIENATDIDTAHTSDPSEVIVHSRDDLDPREEWIATMGDRRVVPEHEYEAMMQDGGAERWERLKQLSVDVSHAIEYYAFVGPLPASEYQAATAVTPIASIDNLIVGPLPSADMASLPEPIAVAPYVSFVESTDLNDGAVVDNSIADLAQETMRDFMSKAKATEIFDACREQGYRILFNGSQPFGDGYVWPEQKIIEIGALNDVYYRSLSNTEKQREIIQSIVYWKTRLDHALAWNSYFSGSYDVVTDIERALAESVKWYEAYASTVRKLYGSDAAEYDDDLIELEHMRDSDPNTQALFEARKTCGSESAEYVKAVKRAEVLAQILAAHASGVPVSQVYNRVAGTRDSGYTIHSAIIDMAAYGFGYVNQRRAVLAMYPAHAPAAGLGLKSSYDVHNAQGYVAHTQDVIVSLGYDFRGTQLSGSALEGHETETTGRYYAAVFSHEYERYEPYAITETHTGGQFDGTVLSYEIHQGPVIEPMPNRVFIITEELLSIPIILCNDDTSSIQIVADSANPEGVTINADQMTIEVRASDVLTVGSEHTVGIIAKDSMGLEMKEYFQLFVQEANRAPEIVAMPNAVDVYQGGMAMWRMEIAEPDGDELVPASVVVTCGDRKVPIEGVSVAEIATPTGAGPTRRMFQIEVVADIRAVNADTQMQLEVSVSDIYGLCVSQCLGVNHRENALVSMQDGEAYIAHNCMQATLMFALSATQ